MVSRLKTNYESWFIDVWLTRGYDAQEIFVGAPEQQQVTLTRQDWRSIGEDNWGAGGMGEWRVDVRRAGTYDVRVDFKPEDARLVEVEIGDVHLEKAPDAGQFVVFEGVELAAGSTTVRARVSSGAASEGAWFVTVTKR